jgi:hypothetical protein
LEPDCLAIDLSGNARANRNSTICNGFIVFLRFILK